MNSGLGSRLRRMGPTWLAGAIGILGGAVHVTLVTMQSYTMRSRGWTRDDHSLARFDADGRPRVI